MFRKRYAQVGLGSRSEMFSEAIALTYRDQCELVGLCDNNRGRLEDRMQWAKNNGVEVPGYSAEEFEKMIRDTHPHVVVVTTVDCYHDDYICRAMELGCDVITEKPMTIDAAKCRRILQTQKRTGRDLKVAFNYRYAPHRAQIKELLMQGVIGDVISVDFHWMLDRIHGADYFRRWHRQKKYSGGLMVHKATHHFDLVHWWLSTLPKGVFAVGKKRFYTPQMAVRYGLQDHGERCSHCPVSTRCPFYLPLEKIAPLKRMYLTHEKFDGYYRDQCVFSEEIDVEDTVAAVVTYENGATMSYSLHAFMPWEGYMVSFNGSKGRIEHKCEERAYIIGDGSIPGAVKAEGTWTRVYPLFEPAYEVTLWESEGGHGGADPLMLKDLFLPDHHSDKYMRAADYRAGAYSILCGVAANESIKSGRMVYIADLVEDIPAPDFTPMPSVDEPITPPKVDVNTLIKVF